MKNLALTTLVVVSFLVTAPSVQGAIPPNNLPEAQGTSRQDTLEVFVAEALNREDLVIADRIIDERLKLDSNAIEWQFFRGIRSFLEISYEQDRQSEENMRKVELAMEKAIEIGERRLEVNPGDSIALFYTGGACGYLGIAKLQGGGGFFKAGSIAKRGFNYHEQLVNLCPSFHDAYLGPGMKNFMVSALPWVFKPILYLLGLSGSEEKAEEYLTIAYEKGRRVHLEAGGYLAQLYERRENWAKSQEIYAELGRRYPYRVMMCLQGLGPLYPEKKYQEVGSRCEAMMRRFENDGHVFSRADSMLMISVISSASYAFQRQGKSTEAIRICEYAIAARAYARLNKWRLHWSLGDFYRDMHDSRKAGVSYREALATAPEKHRNKIQKELDNLASMQ